MMARWILAAGVAALLVTVAAGAQAQGRWQAASNNPGCMVWNAAPAPNARVLWSGTCQGGKADGQGQLDWQYTVNGQWRTDQYVGAMQGGVIHGRGTYFWANGQRYEGDWVNDRRHGQGVLYYPTGDQVHGNWANGRLAGKGRYWRSGVQKWFYCAEIGGKIQLVN